MISNSSFSRQNNGRFRSLFLFPILVVLTVLASGPSPALGSDLDQALKTLDQFQMVISDIAAKAKPAVVNISPAQIASKSSKSEDQPYEKRKPEPPSGSGSGVIVDKKGYIFTNQHVVSDAKEVEVRLSDKRKFIGKVIGRDPDTDLAVVKIEATGDLPTLPLGDSSKVKVGQWAIAVGNPFGLEGTVTLGIISATGRESVNLSRYEDFIQTDASINPGNSGGPLLNLRGEVIGINTAIINFAQGIGFAIPSNMVHEVTAQLIASGKVSRGWLGISIQEISTDLAEKFNIKEGEGILISEVFEGDPAAKAGLKPGDIITRINGQTLTSPSSLSRIIASLGPNKKTDVIIIRDGKTKTIPITLAERKDEARQASYQKPAPDNILGITVSDITPEVREKSKLKSSDKGVMVSKLDPEGKFDTDQLKEGDIIKEIEHTKVDSVADFDEAVKKLKETDSILVLAQRETRHFFLTLKPKDK